MNYREKISSTITTLETGQEEIVRGSDAHLDAILRIKDILITSTELMVAITDGVEENFNNFSKEQAQEMISSLFPLLASAEKMISSIDKSGLANDVASLLQEFKDEIRELKEITNDLSRFRANDTAEWDDFFKD
jgi:hypothetical protein